MRNNRARLVFALVFGAALASLITAAAQAGTTIGILDVTKQVAKIQSQVDALTEAGQTAKTGLLTARAVCGKETLAPVFAAWGDTSDYVMAPSGSFETTGGWLWDPASRLVADNNPFSAGSKALSLGRRGMAASPPMCVTTRHPTIRFFARNTGASDSVLNVSVLYESIDGKIKSLKVATLTAASAWGPTISIPYRVNLLAAASPNGVTAVAFLFQISQGNRKTSRGLQANSHKGRDGDHGNDARSHDEDRSDRSDDNKHDGKNDNHGNNASPTQNRSVAPVAATTPAKPSIKSGAEPTNKGATAAEGWIIDDLYVDPFKTN